VAFGERPELFQWAAWEWGDMETTTVVAATPMDPQGLPRDVDQQANSVAQPMPVVDVELPPAAVHASTHLSGSSPGREMQTMGNRAEL
jgi:hypothetical protein